MTVVGTCCSTFGSISASKAAASILSVSAGAAGIGANVLLVFNDTNATAKAANVSGSMNSFAIDGQLDAAGSSDVLAVAAGAAAIGVNVNYVCPGPVDTPMMLRIEKDFFGDTMTHEEAMAALAGSYAMDKRYAKPEEVANAVLYLASEVSSHTAGMGMHVDSKVSATS